MTDLHLTKLNPSIAIMVWSHERRLKVGHFRHPLRTSPMTFIYLIGNHLNEMSQSFTGNLDDFIYHLHSVLKFEKLKEQFCFCLKGES